MTNKSYKIAEDGKTFIYDDVYETVEDARKVIAEYERDDHEADEQRDVGYWIVDAETLEPVEW